MKIILDMPGTTGAQKEELAAILSEKSGLKIETEPRHTPLPWISTGYVENDYEVPYFKIEQDRRDADGFMKDICPLIAKVTYGGEKEMAANAAFIARACNSHDALLAALKFMFGEIESGNLVRDTSKDAQPDYHRRMLTFVSELGKAQSAIAKAEGRTP